MIMVECIQHQLYDKKAGMPTIPILWNQSDFQGRFQCKISDVKLPGNNDSKMVPDKIKCRLLLPLHRYGENYTWDDYYT